MAIIPIIDEVDTLRLELARLERESVSRQQVDMVSRPSETDFRQLAEHINEVIFLTDHSNSTMLYVSPAYERIFGRSCASLYADPASWTAAIHPDDQWVGQQHRPPHADARAAHAGAAGLTYRIVRPDGGVRLIHVRSFPMLDGRGGSARTAGIAEDITDYSLAMNELRASEQRIRRIVENTPGMFFQCQLGAASGTLVFTHVSEGAWPLLGLVPEAIIADRNVLRGRFAESDGDAFEICMADSAASMTVLNWDGCIQPVDGRQQWVNCRATPRFSTNGDVIWEGVMLDVSEGKENELALTGSRQLLRELSAHRESVRDEERKRIAREVHDDLGQALTVLRMNVSLLRIGFGAGNPELMERIQAMKKQVDATIGIMRAITATLRPVALELGVVAGLEWLVAQCKRPGGPRICLVNDECDDVVLGAGGDTALFRIVQESLNNVLKHAAATEAQVRIACEDGTLCLEVRDNGVGFVTGSERKPGSFGLMGLRERALMLGWGLQIDSVPGQGTCIGVRIPLPAAAPACLDRAGP